ncbi:hypothetical protein [Tamlana flava]|uniref:hypothetical protein n=1 Tax=Tamlana flava TaxID=3158572 RepID=UPI00351AD867
MISLLLEEGGYFLLALLLLLLAFGIPLILIFLGIALRNKNTKASKYLLISAVVYVLIGLGICGSTML